MEGQRRGKKRERRERRGGEERGREERRGKDGRLGRRGGGEESSNDAPQGDLLSPVAQLGFLSPPKIGLPAGDQAFNIGGHGGHFIFGYNTSFLPTIYFFQDLLSSLVRIYLG